MQIIINGDRLEIGAGCTVAVLLARIGKRSDHVAVEHNGELLEPSEFGAVVVEPEDRLEVVHFVGGG